MGETAESAFGQRSALINIDALQIRESGRENLHSAIRQANADQLETLNGREIGERLDSVVRHLAAIGEGDLPELWKLQLSKHLEVLIRDWLLLPEGPEMRQGCELSQSGPIL